MSSCVMTWIADAASSSFSGCRETEVTSTFIRSSTFSCFSSPMVEEPASAAAGEEAAKIARNRLAMPSIEGTRGRAGGLGDIRR